MSQENGKNNLRIWNWRSDSNGHITSISSAFSASFGSQASQDVIGQHLWTFVTGSKELPSGWEELSKAFEKHQKIKKFVFDHRIHNQNVKIVIKGDPIFENSRYKGHEGIGFISDDDEVSIPEIARNMLSISLESLGVGVAIFSKSNGLFEFNEFFDKHLAFLSIKPIRSISYEKIISSINDSAKFLDDISYSQNQESCLYFQLPNKNILSLKKTTSKDNLIVIKTELDETLCEKINKFKQNIKNLQLENNRLEIRIDDYKEKLSDFFNKNSESDTHKSESKKMLSFFQNTLDVGVLITDIDGTLEHVNFKTAQMFGYATASTFLQNRQKDENINQFMTFRLERCMDLIDTQTNRYEHTVKVSNILDDITLKEVIAFYPSVHNVHKIVSFFYPISEEQNLVNNTTQDNKDIRGVQQFFVDYMVNDIKSMVNVIKGYSELIEQNAHTKTDLSSDTYTNDVCINILDHLKDILYISKLSPDLFNLEQTIFTMTSLIDKYLEKFDTVTKEFNIDINYQIEKSDLYIISDHYLFDFILNKLMSCLIKNALKDSKLNILIQDDIKNAKTSLIFQVFSKINLYELQKKNITHIEYHSNLRFTANLDYNIAKFCLEIIGCSFEVQEISPDQYNIQIDISGDMITHKHKRDKDNFVI